MVKRLREPSADLRSINQLVMAGIVGVVDLVEAMHYNVASIPGLLAKPRRDRMTGITGLVYRSIRGIIGAYGIGHLDLLSRPQVYA